MSFTIQIPHVSWFSAPNNGYNAVVDHWSKALSKTTYYTGTTIYYVNHRLRNAHGTLVAASHCSSEAKVIRKSGADFVACSNNNFYLLKTSSTTQMMQQPAVRTTSDLRNSRQNSPIAQRRRKDHHHRRRRPSSYHTCSLSWWAVENCVPSQTWSELIVNPKIYLSHGCRCTYWYLGFTFTMIKPIVINLCVTSTTLKRLNSSKVIPTLHQSV